MLNNVELLIIGRRCVGSYASWIGDAMTDLLFQNRHPSKGRFFVVSHKRRSDRRNFLERRLECLCVSGIRTFVQILMYTWNCDVSETFVTWRASAWRWWSEFGLLAKHNWRFVAVKKKCVLLDQESFRKGDCNITSLNFQLLFFASNYKCYHDCISHKPRSVTQITICRVQF